MHQKRIVFAFTVQQKQPPIWSAVVLLPGSGGLKSFQQKEKADVAMKYYCPGTVFLRNTEKYIWIICDKEQTDLPLHLSMPLLGFDLNLTQVHSWQKMFTEKYTHSTWCHHCPKDGHHHAAILPKDTFHASSSWDHPQSKFNSVKLAASLFFDLMDMISRSLLTDTSLVTSYSSLSHRITHTTAASLALSAGTGQEMLVVSRDLQTASSRSRKKWGTIQMDPAPSSRKLF